MCSRPSPFLPPLPPPLEVLIVQQNSDIAKSLVSGQKLTASEVFNMTKIDRKESSNMVIRTI